MKNIIIVFVFLLFEKNIYYLLKRDKSPNFYKLLIQLLKSSMGGELDVLINDIDIAEQEIKSAALFFKAAQESLKDSIIQRLKNKKVSYSF
ncbi:P12 family lipoprotein [Borreliella bissettiae]|uniref:P12 family lipoprotein n=1 Tax=Borrelia bissettiae TaxID=64897 RepID=UPI003AB6169F